MILGSTLSPNINISVLKKTGFGKTREDSAHVAICQQENFIVWCEYQIPLNASIFGFRFLSQKYTNVMQHVPDSTTKCAGCNTIIISIT
jgi:hypothetical protein